jgi:hypothetical protein
MVPARTRSADDDAKGHHFHGANRVPLLGGSGQTRRMARHRRRPYTATRKMIDDQHICSPEKTLRPFEAPLKRA